MVIREGTIDMGSGLEYVDGGYAERLREFLEEEGLFSPDFLYAGIDMGLYERDVGNGIYQTTRAVEITARGGIEVVREDNFFTARGEIESGSSYWEDVIDRHYEEASGIAVYDKTFFRVTGEEGQKFYLFKNPGEPRRPLQAVFDMRFE